MTRRRVEKGNFRRRVDYAFVAALTHQPKLARIIRDWDSNHIPKFLAFYLNGMDRIE